LGLEFELGGGRVGVIEKGKSYANESASVKVKWDVT